MSTRSPTRAAPRRPGAGRSPSLLSARTRFWRRAARHHHRGPALRSRSRSRSTRRWTLPVVVIGSASMNSISFGYSYGARNFRTCRWMSSSSAVGRRVAGREHDERLDDVAAHFVRRRHDRRIGDRGMPDEAVLDLRRSDPVARGLEHVVGAALVPEVAVGVALREVAGAAPVAAELRRGALRIAEIVEEEDRIARAVRREAIHGDLADLARRRPRGRRRRSPRSDGPGYGRPIEPGFAGHSVCELPTM